MVYVPHPSEREDGVPALVEGVTGMSGVWSLKPKGQKESKKNKKKKGGGEENSVQSQQVVVQQPGGPLTMVTGGAIAGAAPGTVLMMQPPPVEPGSVVIVNQPSQQPGTVVLQQPTGDGSKKKDKGGKDKGPKEEKPKEEDKTPKGGKYIMEKHFGVCSLIVSAMTGCVCAPCIYLCCPCDARTVYVANGERYNKVGYSLSCGGCGCLCC